MNVLVTEDNRQVLTLPEGDRTRHQFDITLPIRILGQGQRMSPDQTASLMTAVVNTDSRTRLKLTNRHMAATNGRVAFLCDTQVSHGYIEGNRIIRYQLTSNSRGTLLEFLRQREAEAKDTIRKIKQLSIECSQQMDELQKERLKSSRASKHSLSDIIAE